MRVGKATRAATSHSCSLLLNNLATNGRQVAYVHHSTAILVGESAVVGGVTSAAQCVPVEEPDGAQIQQVRWVTAGGQTLLVVCSHRSIQIYSGDGKARLHVVTAAVAEGEASPTYRGIGCCITESAEYVVCGVSTGFVCLVPSAGEGAAFGSSLLCPASDQAVVDLCAGPAPHDDLTRALVCTADAIGLVHVHVIEADGTWAHCTTFDTPPRDGSTHVCTATRMRGPHLFCGYSTGHVRIFDLVSCSLCTAISAHARFITALEVDASGLFATASEDTTIGVWTFTGGRTWEGEVGTVVHEQQLQVENGLLSGIAFCGGETALIATAYDQPCIHSWRLTF